ncbi:MAG: tetratricopeptide repeat protein [Gemmatimonadota bacterium]|nr:tetratricopeptide repeat protein [Gemmatimonadota bacterium]
MKILRLMTLLLLIAAVYTLEAAELTGLNVFSEDDYLRIAISLDSPTPARVETNTGENLVFIRFDNTGIERLEKQSYLYSGNPHLESVTFLPLGGGSTVARVKARHPFKVKTYEISNPPRFVLELKNTAGPAGNKAGSVKPHVADYYQSGVRQMRQASFNAALMSFRNAIHAGIRVPDSYYQAGRIRYRMGQLDKAVINFNRGSRSSTYGDEAWLYMSWIHYKKGNRPALLRAWKKFAERLPDAAGRMALASNLPEIDYRALELATGGSASATVKADVSAAAAGQSPDRQSAAFYFERALGLKEDGRLEQAAADLEEAVRLDPTYQQAYFQLGVVYKQMGKPELSAASFEKSLEPQTRAAKPEVEEIEFNPQSASPGSEFSSVSAPSSLDDETRDLLTGDSGGAGQGQETQEQQEEETGVAAGLTTGGPAAGPRQEVMKTPIGLRNRIRLAAAQIVALAQAGLLRKQLWLLTLVTGILFAVTLLGEWMFTGRFFWRNLVTGGGGSQVVDVYRERPSRGRKAAAVRAASGKTGPTIQEKKAQVKEALAMELNSAGRHSGARNGMAAASADRGVTGQGAQAGRPAAVRSGGVYGDDIARRIKDELSRTPAPDERSTSAGALSRGRDSVQARLIRQLRNKQWSISDIAQEMDLSREEVRWALSTPEHRDSSPESKSGEESRARHGQARALFDRPDKQEADFLHVSEQIDREADLELQINI